MRREEIVILKAVTVLPARDLRPDFGLERAAGFVLAGGRSSRMGSDKALALFGGVPLVQVALGIFAEAGLRAQIAGSRSPLAGFAREIPDTWQESGPLGGVHAALSASPAEWNLFLPVDLPLMPSSLLQCLLGRARLTASPVTAARLNGRIQPFPVVLHRSALAPVESRLREGRLACHAAWEEIPRELASASDFSAGDFPRLDAPAVEHLLQCGHCAHPRALPPSHWYRSANTPAELAWLSSLSNASPASGRLEA